LLDLPASLFDELPDSLFLLECLKAIVRNRAAGLDYQSAGRGKLLE
jgi:hypothetical protein